MTSTRFEPAKYVLIQVHRQFTEEMPTSTLLYCRMFLPGSDSSSSTSSSGSSSTFDFLGMVARAAAEPGRFLVCSLCTRRACKLYRARSRLHRSQILQVRVRLKAPREGAHQRSMPVRGRDVAVRDEIARKVFEVKWLNFIPRLHDDDISKNHVVGQFSL